MKIHVLRNIIWRRPLLPQRSSRAQSALHQPHRGAAYVTGLIVRIRCCDLFHHLAYRPPYRQTPQNSRLATMGSLCIISQFSMRSPAVAGCSSAAMLPMLHVMTWHVPCSLKGKISDPGCVVAFDMTTTNFWVRPSSGKSVKPTHLVLYCVAWLSADTPALCTALSPRGPRLFYPFFPLQKQHNFQPWRVPKRRRKT